MAKWLDKYEQGGMVLKKKTKDNFGKKFNPNDVKASVGPGFVGDGYNTKGRNYSPAWGGQFAMGGSMPGAVGFTYARTAGSAPANGKYTKKTKASAQDGKKLYGATDAEEQSVKDFAKSYYASDRFKENLYDKGNFGIKDKSAQISKEAINKINNLSYTYKPLDRTGFDKGNIINMGNPNEYLNAPKDLAFAHEMFHPMEKEILSVQPRNVMIMLNHNALKNRKGDANALYQDMVSPIPTTADNKPIYSSVGDWRQSKIKDFADEEQQLSSTSMHDDLIGEVRADIMALRYLANKKGIWDVTKSGVKDMTPEMLNELYKSPELNKQMYKSDSSGKTKYLPSEKAKAPGNLKGVEAPKNPGLMLDRLKQRYSDKDLLYLMNKLAKNEGEVPMDQAQNGKEMKFYQEGLDFKPKSISKNGSVIKDDRGQWAHPGEITEIDSNEITMQGVDYPVLGVSDMGDVQMMYPGEDYKFDGDKVTEYPMMQGGGWLDKYPEPMRQDATRVAAPIRPLTKKEQEENARINKETQKRTKERDEKIIAERAAKRKTKGDVNVPGSFNIAEKARLFPESVGGVGEMFDDYLNPATYVGVLADALGESIAARDPKAIATSLALAAGTGALGIDPLGSALKVPGKVAQSMESGLLSNAYKLNPYAFKPTEGMMYRGLGKEGMEDAVQSGLFRAKQNVTPTSIGNFNTTRQFSKAYYSPRFDIADQYGQGFIAEVPRAASDWGKRYGKKEWSQIAQRDIPTTEGKILKKDWLKGYKEVSKNKSTKVSEIDWAKWNPEIPKNKKLMEEYINIENSTKANDVWMKNPDGSEFKGTPEQFVQQQSQNFKKAFGNSKLVNPDGSPIMLYHGAPERFNVFDPALFQRGDAGYSGVGIYTTPSKTVADSYAYSSRSFIGGKEHTPTVYELYGQANNPISSEQLVNEGGKRDLFNFNRTANWKGEIPIEERLTGYDAAIANKHPNVTNVRPWNDAYEIVFPTNKQLKSAVGNNGMFDMNNPNIYKALLPAIGVAGIAGASQKKNGGWLSKYK
jgi:hypothetical protein